MKYKVTGKQVVREIKGEVKVNIGMFYLWFHKTGVNIMSSDFTMSPHASNSDYIYRNRNVKDCIREVFEKSIQQIEEFDKEKALAELKEALSRVDEIAELFQNS